MSVFSAAFASLMLQAPPVEPARVEAADVERVADAVERAMPRSRMLEGLVTRRQFVGKQGDPSPHPDRDAPQSTSERIVRLLGSGRSITSERPLATVNVTADGMTYQVRLGETDASVRREADPHNGDLALLLQVDSFAPLSLQAPSLPGAIRACHPISFALNGNIATLRFTDAEEQKQADERFESWRKNHPDDAPWKATPREVTVDLSEPPRVIAFAMDMPRPKGGDPFRLEWVIDEWQQFDGALLARKMHIATAFPNDTPNLQVIELSRLSAVSVGEKRTVSDAHPLPAGLHVIDDESKFSFTVGSDAIIFEGRHLTLKQPLWLHPGDKLQELVRDAVEE